MATQSMARCGGCLLLLLAVLTSAVTLTSATSARVDASQAAPGEEFFFPLNHVTPDHACVVCTMSMALVSQLSKIHHTTPENGLEMLCSFMPDGINSFCGVVRRFLGPTLVKPLNSGGSADDACANLGICRKPQCRLFPQRPSMLLPKAVRMERISGLDGLEDSFVSAGMKFLGYDSSNSNPAKGFKLCRFLPGLCSFTQHIPNSDEDRDLFSSKPRGRGYHWRGRDCDDKDANIYPGLSSSDEVTDGNCNGIHGVNNETGRTYEEEWCHDSQPRGVVVIGDSVGAGFQFPSQWLLAAKMNQQSLKNIVEVLENEINWPMLSWATGHRSPSEFPHHGGDPMNSIYARLRERNLCNHRDYHNLGVNGAAVKHLVGFLDYVSPRGGDKRKPLLTIFAMNGIDVCDRAHTTDAMTTPEVFLERIEAALVKANSVLPPNSTVVILPISDGRVLYEASHKKLHPIGSFNRDVTMSQFYDYLNCLEISPCWGWMNTNETVRNATYERASELNAQWVKAVEDAPNRYPNIHVVLYNDVMGEVWSQYEGDVSDLVDPVDGLHPTQLAHSLMGTHFSNRLEADGLLGPVNPHNDAIRLLFGDQNGH